MRRIGMLLTLAADDPEIKDGITVFRQQLQQAGWSEGATCNRVSRGRRRCRPHRENAAELVAAAPEVIFALGTANVGRLLQVTRTVPIVFAYVADPVGAGFVESLARPGGNATGLYPIRLRVEREMARTAEGIAPGVTRAAILRDPAISAGIGQWGAIQTVAPAFGVEVSPINVREAGEIERAVANFARSANGGLIVTGSALAAVHDDLITGLATRYKLPTIYFLRRFVVRGGLISYGPDIIDQYRRGAGYVDRILRGEKPADLAVQAPTKYELVLNLKTAKALGLEVPPSLLARADEVIE